MKLFYISQEKAKNKHGEKYLELQPINLDTWIDDFNIALSSNKINLVWDTYRKDRKKSGHYAHFTGGPCIRADAFEKMQPYCIGNKQLIRFQVKNPNCDYVFIDVQNFTETDSKISHIFSMWPKFRLNVVTEVFKNAWESNRFTGAEFEYVGDLPDEQFLKIS